MFSILFHDIVYETDTGDSMSDSDDDEQCPLDTNERMSATTWLECAEDFRMVSHSPQSAVVSNVFHYFSQKPTRISSGNLLLQLKVTQLKRLMSLRI